MDSQAQLHRTHGQHQAEKPIKINHPEEEEHHEKGPTKVLKKVKEKAKKIKKALTGHGHEHEHTPDDHDLDEEDDDYYEDTQIHGGAPSRGKAHIPVKEEIAPPGTNVFPVVSSSHTKEPLRHPHESHGHQTLPPPSRPSGVPETGERRGGGAAATLTPHNTPVSSFPPTEDVKRTFVPGEHHQHGVHIERPRGLEEDTAAHCHGGISNYQNKVTDPTGKAVGVVGAGPVVAALESKKGEQLGFGRDQPEKSYGLGSNLPAGNIGSGFEKEIPVRSHGSDLGHHGFDSRAQERPRGLVEDPDAHRHGGISNYQSKVTDPTAAGVVGTTPVVADLERKKGEHIGIGRDPPKKNIGLGSNPPAGNIGSGFEKEIPVRSHGSDLGDHGFDSRAQERPRGLVEDPAAHRHGGISSDQSRVTDPTAVGVTGAGASSVAGIGTRGGTSEHDEFGFGRNLPEKRLGLGSETGKNSPEGDIGSGVGKEIPVRSHFGHQGFDSRGQERGDETHQPNQSSYTDKIASVTSVVADKAVAARNAVASKLGYSGEGGDGGGYQNPPSSGGGYGDKVVGVVAPVYEKVKETGASVLTKLPLTGGTGGTRTGTETERQQGLGQDKGVSAKEYVTEKLSPGEEDKALSKVVAEKLHLGGGGGGGEESKTAKRGTVTQSEEVEKRLGGFKDQRHGEATKHGEAFAEEGEGGMVDKLRGAVTSWITGTTDEVMQKSTESVQDSSASLGSTIGNRMTGSGAGGAGQLSGGKSGSVPVQKRFQEN